MVESSHQKQWGEGQGVQWQLNGSKADLDDPGWGYEIESVVLPSGEQT